MALALFAPLVSAAPIILYENDFETPNVPHLRTCGFALDDRDVNLFYGSAQSTFQQQFTVETVLINNTDGGITYSDPAGIGGDYAIGMLSSVQPDLLALTFDTQGKDFINVGMDISAIDVQGCGGPFGVANPKFRITLVDSPGGVFNFGAGTVLDQAEITGVVGPNGFTFNWTNHVVALDTSGSTDGTITIVWDLLQSGYAAFDNLIITASDTTGCGDGIVQASNGEECDGAANSACAGGNCLPDCTCQAPGLPTVSESGLAALMSLLLAGIAIALVRRRAAL